MPQACQDAAPDNLDAGFDFGLVARLVRARWNDGGAVMPRQVGVGPIDCRLMEAGLGDPGLEIVANRLAGDAAENKARTCAAIQSGSFWLHTASAYVKLDAPRTATKICTGMTSPVRPST